MEAGTSKRCALVGSFFDLPHIEPLPHPKAAAVFFDCALHPELETP